MNPFSESAGDRAANRRLAEISGHRIPDFHTWEPLRLAMNGLMHRDPYMSSSSPRARLQQPRGLGPAVVRGWVRGPRPRFEAVMRRGPETFLVLADGHDDDLPTIGKGRAPRHFGAYANPYRKRRDWRHAASVQRRLRQPIIDKGMKKMLGPVRQLKRRHVALRVVLRGSRK
jgi:hypothetical protein